MGKNHAFKDIAGQRFTRVTVLEKTSRRAGESVVWRCRCDCGKFFETSGSSLRKGHTRSCGCLQRDAVATAIGRRSLKHGATRVNGANANEYNIWQSMKARCLNPNVENYNDYGGRGIRVCKQWLDSFEAFLAYMGPRPSTRHSLDRFPNNDGNYEPGNVRWATAHQQGRNRRDNKFLEHAGHRLTVADWARELGWPAYAIHTRLRRGMSVAEALTTPMTSGPKKKLSADNVRTIRQRLADGHPQRAIAKDFGVSLATVSHIKSGRLWSGLK